MLFTNKEAGCFAKDPAVVRFHDQYLMYYSLRHNDGSFGIGIAVSDDLEHWTASGEIPRTQSCEAHGIAAPGAIVLNGQVHLFYQTYGNGPRDAICHAVSENGIDFAKHPENPVFRPSDDWCCGRAIDADVCIWNGRLHLYFATRDHAMRIQKVGGAWAALDSGFGKAAWTQLANQSLLTPELSWEGECIESACGHCRRRQPVYVLWGIVQLHASADRLRSFQRRRLFPAHLRASLSPLRFARCMEQQ